MRNFKQSNNLAFNQEVGKATRLYEKAIKHSASQARSMLKSYGNIGALEDLINNGDIQKGFRTLRDKKIFIRAMDTSIVLLESSIVF